MISCWTFLQKSCDLGINPKNGKPHTNRLYSIASTRYGDDKKVRTTIDALYDNYSEFLNIYMVNREQQPPFASAVLPTSILSSVARTPRRRVFALTTSVMPNPEIQWPSRDPPEKLCLCQRRTLKLIWLWLPLVPESLPTGECDRRVKYLPVGIILPVNSPRLSIQVLPPSVIRGGHPSCPRLQGCCVALPRCGQLRRVALWRGVASDQGEVPQQLQVGLRPFSWANQF